MIIEGKLRNCFWIVKTTTILTKILNYVLDKSIGVVWKKQTIYS